MVKNQVGKNWENGCFIKDRFIVFVFCVRDCRKNPLACSLQSPDSYWEQQKPATRLFLAGTLPINEKYN